MRAQVRDHQRAARFTLRSGDTIEVELGSGEVIELRPREGCVEIESRTGLLELHPRAGNECKVAVTNRVLR